MSWRGAPRDFHRLVVCRASLLLANATAEMLLAEVEKELAALEAACAEGERALLVGNSEELDSSIANQRRLTHALQNAMDASKTVRTPEFNKRILDRIRLIGLTRDRHISTMRQQGEKIQEQLNTLTAWKRAARKWLTGFQERRTSGVDHTQ